MNANITYPHIARMFYAEPLALELQAMMTIHTWLWPRTTGQIVDAAGLQPMNAAKSANSVQLGGFNAHRRRTFAMPSTDGFGSVTDDRYYWSVEGREDIAVIPISGMIMKGASSFEESCFGAVSTERIGHALQQAVSAKEVRHIVLDISSPGGRVTGVKELGEKIAAATQVRGKTVSAFTEELVASAAYWLASQADQILTTSSGSLGSIGTYLAFFNESVAMQTKGIKLEVFRQGKHKALGLPGMDLTQEDRQYLQDGVNKINAQFVAAVRAGRGKVSEEAVTDAKVYDGPGAIAQGLADGLVSSWEEFISLL
ncbi:MAG: S49 family peptidase [Verrucomicrobiaceae bacterium]|nr:S49 family peptidase [Verrucomicrobiaceae bacterium]